jgi:hypothetical protein
MLGYELDLVSSLSHSGPLLPTNYSPAVPALSDFVMSMSDHLAPSLEHNTALTNELLSGQSSANWPNLVMHIFNMYKTALLHSITKRHIFRYVLACVHSIKFQKRGLLHMHLLLSLFPHHQPSSAANMDSIIHAS